MWSAAIGLGLNLVGGIMGNRAQRRQAQQAAARAALNNKLREANNIRETAVANLNRHVQSLQNQRVQEAAGREYRRVSETLAKQDDFATVQRFEMSLQGAEAAGRVAAAAATSGNQQGMQDVIDAMRLQEARQAESLESAQEFQRERGAVALAGITADAASSLDMRMVFPNLDWNVDEAPRGPSGGFLGLLGTAALQTANQIGPSGVASIGQSIGSWFQPTSYSDRGWFDLGG